MTLTEKLNILMDERGMTRGTLAERTGIPYNTIVGFYTKGYRNMKLSTLKRIGAFFGISLDILCDDTCTLDGREQSRTVRQYQTLNRANQAVVDLLVDSLAQLQQPESAQAAHDAPAAQEAQAADGGQTAYIREFLSPAAAGSASPVLNEDYVLAIRTPDIPAAADYAVRIAGNSMEPFIHDGARVYVSRTNELAAGDVGIFFVDGDMKCKQFFRDDAGNIRLLSLNRACRDTDMYIPASSGITVFCFGRVLLERRPPQPKC